MENKKINKNFLIVILGILAALGPFSIDMYLPAFGSIAKDFGTDEKNIAQTLTSYFIGIAFGQLIYGPIVDKIGRKKSLLTGLSIYIIASIGCSISINLEMMVFMRLLQALGGCAGMVASNAIITDVYEVDQRAKAFSSIMLVMGVAPLVAPSVGSMFIDQYSWRYIFYFLTGFSVLVLLLISNFLPETAHQLNDNKLKTRIIIKNYFQISCNKIFLLNTLAGSLAMAVLFAYITSAAFIFLNFYQLDKKSFSIVFAINASGIISGSYINGLLTKHFNYKKISNVTAVLLIISTVISTVIIFLNPQISYQWIVLSLFTILFFIGFISPNVSAASYEPFKGNLGSASALGGFYRMGIAAIAAAIIGVFQDGKLITPFIIISIITVLVGLFLLILKKIKF